MLKELKYKDIKPIYKIDEYGNVYSKYKKDYLKPKKDKDGYLKLSLRGFSGILYVRIATLVVYNFIGEPPKEIKDITVDHIDRNRLNNHYTNLRWLERAENTRIANKVSQLGSKNNQAKLSEKQVIEICELLIKNELTLFQIAQLYNVDKSTINNILQQTNWKKITLKYTFPNKKRKYFKPVDKFDLKGNYLETYENITEATKLTNINNISSCCKGKIKTAGGYIWKYREKNK